jgi:hypothetical protein
MTVDSLIYLYCVTSTVPNLTEAENLVDELYSVSHDGLYAVVSKVKESEFGEKNFEKNLDNLEWIKEKVATHENVVEGIMEGTCVVPFKFGTIFRTEDNLKTMLAEHTDDLRQTLEKLKGTEEWGVKIFYDKEKVKKSLRQEKVAELQQMDEQINSSTPGRVFFLRKKREELLNAAVNDAVAKYGQDSIEMLSRKSIAIRRNELLPKEATERKDDMILNVAFLVEKSRTTQFLLVLDDLKVRYGDKGLSFDCTGPWPPYNFCQLPEGKVQYG